MKVALVHDWLNGMRGGEKILEVLCELLPEADIFTLLYEPCYISDTINSHKVTKSFIQSLPYAKNHYRLYLPLFPLAVESFDLKGYDVVISISHCVAKGVIPSPNAKHICYCLTPMRYIWDLYHQYFNDKIAGRGKRVLASLFAHYLRIWDVNASVRVNEFAAISNNIANKIQRYYGRTASVIYPPVDTDFFVPAKKGIGDTKNEYYLIVSALVPYKRVDVAVEAFNILGKRLVVVGKGPDERKLKARARSNVTFTGWIDNESLRRMYQGCKALVFPGEEDFGIVPLEAQSCGKPVIAYSKGGSLETIIVGETGIFFKEQTIQSLVNAIKQFEKNIFDEEIIRSNACNFDRKLFKEEIKKFIVDKTGLSL